jgi:predicted GH43/DUF377 family glycosyl hydrolase
MRQLFILALVVVTVLHAHAQDGFILASSEPIFIEEDIQFNDPGAGTYHDGQFHMFYNSFDGWPVEVNIHYATSSDGINWEIQVGDDLLDTEGLDWVGLTPLASSVLVEDDGTWVMYFYAWQEQTSFSPTVIGRASAPAPEGPWTVDAEPVLVPGDGWDSLQVAAPSVVKSDGQYYMYYTGAERQTRLAVGLATSEDGINWTKYDEPILTSLGNPSQRERLQQVWQPRVVVTPEGDFTMVIKTGSNFANFDVAYATSENGIDWTPVYDPLAMSVAGTGLDDARAIWFTELAYHEGTYYLFLEVGNGSATRIYVATMEE